MQGAHRLLQRAWLCHQTRYVLVLRHKRSRPWSSLQMCDNVSFPRKRQRGCAVRAAWQRRTGSDGYYQRHFRRRRRRCPAARARRAVPRRRLPRLHAGSVRGKSPKRAGLGATACVCWQSRSGRRVLTARVPRRVGQSGRKVRLRCSTAAVPVRNTVSADSVHTTRCLLLPTLQCVPTDSAHPHLPILFAAPGLSPNAGGANGQRRGVSLPPAHTRSSYTRQPSFQTPAGFQGVRLPEGNCKQSRGQQGGVLGRRCCENGGHFKTKCMHTQILLAVLEQHTLITVSITFITVSTTCTCTHIRVYTCVHMHAYTCIHTIQILHAVFERLD